MTGIKPHRALSPATKKAVLFFVLSSETTHSNWLQWHSKKFHLVHGKWPKDQRTQIKILIHMRIKQHIKTQNITIRLINEHLSNSRTYIKLTKCVLVKIVHRLAKIKERQQWKITQIVNKVKRVKMVPTQGKNEIKKFQHQKVLKSEINEWFIV